MKKIMNKISNVAKTASGHLSGCMLPVIPIIIAASLIKLTYLILTTFGLITGSTQTLLYVFGDVPFYFLPITVAYSASRHFDTDPFYALGAACVLIAPDFVSLMTGAAPVSFLGLPIMQNSYSYNVLPVILITWLISVLYPRTEKLFSPALKSTLFPFLFFLGICLIEIALVAPLGSVAGLLLSKLFAWGSAHAGVITWGVLGALFIFLVPTGMHWIFVTTAITDISSKGFDMGIQAAFLLMVTAAAGVDLAYSFKAKSPEDRATYISYVVGALTTGVSEPSLFGVILRDPGALRAAILACVIPGIYQGIFGMRCFIYSFPAVSSILIFFSPDYPMNIIHTVIGSVMAFVLGFVFTMIFVKEALPSKMEK